MIEFSEKLRPLAEKFLGIPECAEIMELVSTRTSDVYEDLVISIGWDVRDYGIYDEVKSFILQKGVVTSVELLKFTYTFKPEPKG